MGLATDIVKFFYIDFDSHQAIRTLEDFGKSQPGWEKTLNIVEVLRVCTHLEQHGYLMEARTPHDHPILGRAFVAPGFDERRAQYGEYDFIGYGFARVRADLGDAVRPVVVTKNDGEEDIGNQFPYRQSVHDHHRTPRCTGDVPNKDSGQRWFASSCPFYNRPERSKS
jgi:hypothetical protein